MHFLPANRLRLYRNFKAIEPYDFHGVVRFYEQFEDGIRALDFEEYFDCTLIYTNALFETAQYGKHGVMCDQLLEQIIMYNIDTWGGIDLYARILHDKAVSLFYLQEYSAAEHVLRELIKMQPEEQAYCRLLYKALQRRKPRWLMTIQAIALVLFLTTALTVAVHIFVIRPFFPDLEYIFNWIYYGLLGLGLLVYLAGETGHAWRCNRSVHRFVKRQLKKKRGISTGF